MRAAVVGGGAYAMGRRAANRQAAEQGIFTEAEFDVQKPKILQGM